VTTPASGTLGLFAGNGRLPFVFAEAARARGISVAAVAIREETDPDLEARVDRLGWFHVGQLSAMIGFLRSAGCREVVMAGQLRLRHLFDDWEALKADPLALDLISRIADRRGDSVLAAVADVLEAQGIRLRESTFLLEESVARPGTLTPREPTKEEEEEIAFGWRMAKALAELAIGQTVVVKRRAVVAVEGVEGTDACIRRGGELGGEGVVVVKVSKPSQDLRFDLPVIGPKTVRALADARASLLAVEAGKTLILDRKELVELAEKEGVAIVARRGPGQVE
jgi:DUF1009 family protein